MYKIKEVEGVSFAEFIKKNLMIYFIIVTGITIAIAILGLIYDPSATFGYDAFFSPIIFGMIAILPSFVLYSKKELTFKQMLLRRMLHFIILEIMLLGFGYQAGLLGGIEVRISFAISVFMIYLFTQLIHWMIDSRTAVQINMGLKKIQS